jgi:hypothetical protein
MQSQTLEKNVIPKLIIFEKFNSDFYYNVQTRKSNQTSFEKNAPQTNHVRKVLFDFFIEIFKKCKTNPISWAVYQKN